MDDADFAAQQKSQEITPELVQVQDINGEETVKADAPATDAGVIFAQLKDRVLTTAISPDGRQIIVGSKNGTLQLFDLINGTPHRSTLPGTSSLRHVGSIFPGWANHCQWQ
jgi:WD40 repeat protein